ncbi:MAG: DUF1232 domain-containing protein [Candidatus Neomarinimicrobiota bacterium]
MTQSVSLKLTAEDIARYEREIEQIDLAVEHDLLARIPDKIQTLMRARELSSIQASLVQDISKLVLVLRNAPNIDIRVKKKIIFALQYFYNPYDEIPDSVANLGFLDDAIVVHWVVEQIARQFPEYFQV